MAVLRVVPLLLLLVALSGLGSATDYGAVSTLDFNLAPGESATQSQEVSRCREEGCTDTLRLAVAVPPDFSGSVNPPEIRVEKAKVGQAFSASVTVSAKASAVPGRSEGALQVVSGSGDTWRYKLNLTVRASAAAPAPARTSGGTGSAPGGGAASAPQTAATAPQTTVVAPRGGPDPTLPLVGGGVVVAVLLLFLLQRRGLLPRGVPRPSRRSPGRGERETSGPRGSPLSAILQPVGAVVGAVTTRVKGLASRTARAGPGARRAPPFARASRHSGPAEDSQLESEWERFIHEKLPGEAGAAGPEEMPPGEAPADEAPPPVVGDLPPEEEPALEEGPPPAPESEGPVAEEPQASGPEPGVAEPMAMEPEPAPGPAATVPDEALLALQRDLERMRAGMGTLADLKRMMERTLDDLRGLREEVDRVRSAPRLAAAPAMAAPAVLPPDALKKLQADLKQEMAVAIELQMAANTEKLGTWLREALKAVTLMKAQTPQTGGPPGTTGLQPLFDGLWKEVGSLRNAIQRLDAETKNSLQELAHSRAPGGGKEAGALEAALEKQRAQVADLAGEVQVLRSERAKPAPEPGVALSADLDALRTILRDIQRQMEGVEARLKNQELTFARGDEVRNLFRDLSAVREDLAEVRMVMEEGRMPVSPAVPAASGGQFLARAPTVEAPPPQRREEPDAEGIRKEIEKQEAFLSSLEEYRRSGLMPERLYLEKKGQSEERLRELKRKSRL